jgi:hypothetical protein
MGANLGSYSEGRIYYSSGKNAGSYCNGNIYTVGGDKIGSYDIDSIYSKNGGLAAYYSGFEAGAAATYILWLYPKQFKDV